MNQSFEQTRIPVQKMEVAARNVDKAIASDSAAPTLLTLMNVNPQSGPTASGLTDNDYPVLSGIQFRPNSMAQIKEISHIPLPAEVLEHFNHVQCHCMMGLFPEIGRAWLTVDSDIYIWTYEENGDLAYFDGLNETIHCVGLIRPKPGVFHNFIKYLLVLTTTIDIIVLGVTFSACTKDPLDEIQLISDPVFTIPTDGSSISCVTGTALGRLFLGSKEGSLFEITYQAESGWFGKRCKKVNHSTSALSFLVPSFINAALSEEDGISQIVVDNSRHILYVLTEKGCIEVYDLGEKGNCFYKITRISQSNLVHQAMNTVKTLDSQNFRPIVSISPVEASESHNIHLVAVTQTGVRFYLTATGVDTGPHNQRPYKLSLLHVRLPPGYSANITSRPRCVHMAHYRDRNLLLLSTINEKDVLWCISSDLFPFRMNLMETYTTLNLDGPALAVAEIRTDNTLLLPSEEAAPLVVRQHFEPPKKYVILTSQGVHVFLKVRPVDILRQLLIDSQGQDSEAVKAFFMIEKEDQACATSLILASLECEENYNTADYAARAFFVFGGEPKVSPGVNMMSQTALGQTMFSPNVISTPRPGYRQAQYSIESPNTTQNMGQSSLFDTGTSYMLSAKHNGLYLYLGRILRPVWNRRCVERVLLDSKTSISTSSITSLDCIQILHNLNALHNFLVTNTQLSLGNPANQSSLGSALMTTGRPGTIQDAQLEERNSLDALKVFVFHCCQILGFWRILCEHQSHTLISTLPEEQQNSLQVTAFKDLFLYGQNICSYLINALVNSYLGDNASVDSISAKLREVCPTLYKPEDAAYSKANEILTTSRSVQNVDEKEEMVATALELCKSIAPCVNLDEICKQFMSLKAYRAIVELCVVCAKKFDPENVAEHYYKNADPVSDSQSFQFYQKRMDVYQQVTKMLNTVLNEQIQQLSATSPSLNASSPSLNASVLTSTTHPPVSFAIQTLIDEILEYPDELLHVALYEWMIARQMTSALIKVDKPSLETFLLHMSQSNEQNSEVMDLLWKYYETSGNYSQAAKVLNNMASKTGHNIDLKKRLEYLSRAIMSMRSDKIGYAPYLGVFLKDLEDKLEIAKVQEQILNAVMNIRGLHPNAEEAIVILNSGLYQISQLYENFANPMELWECQLAIIDCAGYSDPLLVEKIWRNILKKEFPRIRERPADELMGVILSKVKMLSRRYGASTHCFPLGFIIRELEVICATIGASRSLTPKALFAMNLPFLEMLDVYNKLIICSSNDRFWQSEQHEFHLPESVAALIEEFLANHDSFSSVDKRKIIAQCQDNIAEILSSLYSKPNSQDLVNVLRNIQSRLSRL